MKPTTKLASLLALMTPTLLVAIASADDIGFDGKIVEPDCDAMSPWYECRRIRDAPAAVRRGYEYIHHTSRTLGPDGRVRFADGTPYATTTTACSSCHFAGGAGTLRHPHVSVPGQIPLAPLFPRAELRS